MERTAIRLGGIELGSCVMNASGVRSAERGEIYELCAVHNGPLVFKSCNIAGLEAPENLKNRGVEFFAGLARELISRGKIVVGSVVGETEDEFVTVAGALDRAGVQIIELNLADDFVTRAIAPFGSMERLKALLGRVRGEVGAVMAVKMAPTLERDHARSYADVLKAIRVQIAVCANDLHKDLEVDLKTATAKGPRRALSQVHAFYLASDQVLDIVAVGGIGSGREAYIAALTGAKASQVGSALFKEGAGALGRIDREFDALLAENGKISVSEVVGRLEFTG